GPTTWRRRATRTPCWTRRTPPVRTGTCRTGRRPGPAGSPSPRSCCDGVRRCGAGASSSSAAASGRRPRPRSRRRAGRGARGAAHCFAETLAYCRYNALRNAGRAPRTLLADWRTAAGRAVLERAGPFDLLLAADVLYEPEDIAPLLDLPPRLLAAGGAFWLAE